MHGCFWEPPFFANVIPPRSSIIRPVNCETPSLSLSLSPSFFSLPSEEEERKKEGGERNGIKRMFTRGRFSGVKV